MQHIHLNEFGFLIRTHPWLSPTLNDLPKRTIPTHLTYENLKKDPGDSKDQTIRLQGHPWVLYTSAYQEAYDNVCSLITANLDLTIKGASMLLQAALLMNMGSEYTGIVSAIESEWENGTTDLESIIVWLVKFEAIWKGSAKGAGEPSKATVLFSASSSNPESLLAPKGPKMHWERDNQPFYWSLLPSNTINFVRAPNSHTIKWDLEDQKQTFNREARSRGSRKTHLKSDKCQQYSREHWNQLLYKTY